MKGRQAIVRSVFERSWAKRNLKLVLAFAVAPALCAVLAGCAAVNADAGRSATDRFALFDRDAAPVGTPVSADASRVLGSFPENIVGSIVYLGDTTDISGRGTVVVGPGTVPSESIVSRFREPSAFPYEVVTLAATSLGSFLTAIQVINPLDSRVVLQCTIADGIKLDPSGSPQHNQGRCVGGTTLRSTTGLIGRRQARWNGRDLQLLTTQTDIVFSGAITGTLSERNDVPSDNQTLALRTELDVDINQSGNNFHQHITRTVIPPAQER